MKCELKILSGARAGHREVFDKAYIGLGRHPMSDVKFDAEKDIDASTRHAAILLLDDLYVLRDLGSTNGTFVDGQRTGGDVVLKDGDVIRFGVHGPEVSFHILRDQEEVVMEAVKKGAGGSGLGAGEKPAAPRATHASVPSGRHNAPPQAVSSPAPSPQPPSKTSVLRAEIVAQRSRFRAITAFLLIVLIGSGSVLVWSNVRSQRRTEMAEARADSIAVIMAQMTAARQEADSVMRALRTQLAAEQDPGRRASLQVLMTNAVTRVQRIDSNIAMADDVDYNAIKRNNQRGVAVIIVELEGDTSQFYTGTAFGVSPEGLLLTNKHVVAGRRGDQRATRIGVQFAGSSEFLRARVERVAPDADIALIRITDAGPFPVVAGLDPAAVPAAGAPIALLGFPGYGGEGSIPRATLVTGNVTRVVPDSLLELEAYSGVGASGSPILDAQGRVIGIEFGGIGGTRAVFGLPIRRAMALLNR